MTAGSHLECHTRKAHVFHHHEKFFVTLPQFYSFFSSVSTTVSSARFAEILSCLRSRAALVLARLASISSLMIRARCASALALWI